MDILIYSLVYFCLFLIIIIFSILFRRFYYSKAEEIINSELTRTPRISIAQFQEGSTGKIVGRLECIGEPLISPLTGHRCAQYSSIVEKNNHPQIDSWTTLIKDEDKQDFILKDNTGIALIRNAPIIVNNYEHLWTGWKDKITPELEHFLTKYRKKSTAFYGFLWPHRYKEGALGEGEEVIAYGTGRWENDPDQDQSKRLVIYSPVLRIVGNN
jgi:hypothetical protein